MRESSDFCTLIQSCSKVTLWLFPCVLCPYIHINRSYSPAIFFHTFLIIFYNFIINVSISLIELSFVLALQDVAYHVATHSNYSDNQLFDSTTLSCTFFEPWHSLYTLYRVPDLAAIGKIYNVFCYDAVWGRDSDPSPTRQQVDALHDIQSGDSL